MNNIVLFDCISSKLTGTYKTGMAVQPVKMCFFGLALGLAVVRTEETQKKKQPNILFVLADDLGWNQVGKSFVSSKT